MPLCCFRERLRYPTTDSYDKKPFASDVSEGKNDPIYKAHSYHTKVFIHKAIVRYILHYTAPGDVVFDGFCGTGMTGVAANLCDDKSRVASFGYKSIRWLIQDGADLSFLHWVNGFASLTTCRQQQHSFPKTTLGLRFSADRQLLGDHYICRKRT